MMKPGPFDTSKWIHETGGLAKRCWCHPRGSTSELAGLQSLRRPLPGNHRERPGVIESMPVTREYEKKLHELLRPAGLLGARI